MLKHAAESAHLIDSPQGEFCLTWARVCHVSKPSPGAARRVRNDRQPTRIARGVTLFVPHVAAVKRLVYAIRTGEKYGYLYHKPPIAGMPPVVVR